MNRSQTGASAAETITTQNKEKAAHAERLLPSVDLRDYFAAAALTGILSCREQYLAVLADRKEAFPEEAIALECGRLADAMLKAREGKS